MNKDVIYIDVDDDVTAIIGKIKKAKEKVVAIVPPKRIGALQSAVNLRLLERMAKTEKKKLVIVTTNPALVALAANNSIPVAKNLQSKPELAEVPALAVDEGDDIIDGGDLPVGDHADTVEVHDNTQQPDSIRSDVVDELNIDGEEVSTKTATGAPKKSGGAKDKIKSKIPNFDKFRKRLFLGIAGGVALIALLVWMFAFAPAATVIVTARTTPVPVSSTVELSETKATSYEEGIVKVIKQEQKQDASVQFEATGTKDVGDKATGVLRLTKLSQSDQEVPAGSRYTTPGGLVFTTDTDATIPASVPCFPTYCAQTVDVGVTAEDPGEQYNNVSGTATGPSGTTGTFQGATSGGTSKVAKVVSQEDVEKARASILEQSPDGAKQALIEQFTNGEKVIDSSFSVSRGDQVSSPAVDKEAPENGMATLTIPTTYTIYAIAASELEDYLMASLESDIDEGQANRVYSAGVDGAELGGFKKSGDTITVIINTTGSIGPELDEATLKDMVKGKIYGEVQSQLESIDGIQEVDVQFSYFWVRSVPNDANKITIEFQVQDEN